MRPPEPDYARLTEFLCGADLQILLQRGPELARAIPELEATLDFQQHSPHHAYDLYTHIAHVTAAVPPEPVLRWAALLHDVGKPDTFTRDETGRGHFHCHAQVGAAKGEAILRRLGAPEELNATVTRLIACHMLREDAPRPALTPGEREALACLQQADMRSKGT